MSDVKEDNAEPLEPWRASASSAKTFGRHFIDEHGRILHLRGANVSASSKVPINDNLPLHDHSQASYIDRPFPLAEAPEHWRRLKSWGLTFIRINVTWDAIEHAGRGQYDMQYLDYLRGLVEGMADYGLVAYISMHQDVWSRYCGGSGAPGWTLEAAGFDPSNNGENLVKSGAAFLDGIRGGRMRGERGLWPTGYQKLAAASMNTFFWGGEHFAQSVQVEHEGKKVNIQQYLQDAFVGAYEKLIEALGDLDSVMGFEMLNEPHPGFIGLPTLQGWDYNTDLHLGDYPSPYQAMCMGAGHPTPGVPHYSRSFPYPTRRSRRVVGNPTSTSAWTTPCPWEAEGVWRWSNEKKKPFVLQENYFVKGPKGRPVDFYQDHYWPFVRRWQAMVDRKLEKGKGKMRMLEAIPNQFCPEWPEDARPDNFVYAPHWYDLNALFKKQFGRVTVNVQGLSRGMTIFKALYVGKKVKKNYQLQIRNIVHEARQRLGDVPVIIGETGVPMDLNHEAALRTGDWKWPERMMDAIISALEANLIGFNLWTYNPTNKDDTGDDWNAENFSFYSNRNRDLARSLLPADEKGKEDLDLGGRLLDAIVRPYAVATSGTPLSHNFDSETTVFTYRYSSILRISANSSDEVAPTTQAPVAHMTEIFIPRRLYPEGQVEHQLSVGGRMRFDFDNQRAYVWFNDLPAWRDKGKADKIRRVDIWRKGGRTKPQGVIPWSTVWFIVFLLLGLAGVVSIQQWQWRLERRKGIAIGEGWF